MSDADQQLRDRLPYLSDEEILAMVQTRPEEYTPEALAVINEEVVKRGGLQSLKEKAGKSRSEDQTTQGGTSTLPPELQDSNEIAAKLRRLYPLYVAAAYGLFMYAINGSLWFYWLLLFALIAAFFAVLFRPPFNPQDEIKELNSRPTDDTPPESPDPR
jgi:hypothetical protein